MSEENGRAEHRCRIRIIERNGKFHWQGESPSIRGESGPPRWDLYAPSHHAHPTAGSALRGARSWFGVYPENKVVVYCRSGEGLASA